MANTFVVCIDGTWNAPGQIDRDPDTGEEVKTETNVVKTWQALTGRKLDLPGPCGSVAPLKNQAGEAIYLNGVGSSGSFFRRTIDGATGAGISKRILDAYQFLAERWEEGDQIFGFGFSRGAFAIRSLFGFIEQSGLPRHPSQFKEHELRSLFRCYQLGENIPCASCVKRCRIDFLGLWDTVGALLFENTLNNFHEIHPGNVTNVCHALALDEQREQFCPDLFPSQNVGQSVKEVWFAGAHSNVGGGYSDQNLSNIALFWILLNASQAGLTLNLNEVPGWYAEDIQGHRRPSYDNFWRGMGAIGSIVAGFGLYKACRSIPEDHRVHESVCELMEHGYKPRAARNNGQLRDSAVELWGFD